MDCMPCSHYQQCNNFLLILERGPFQSTFIKGQWRKAKGTIIFCTFSLSKLGPIREIFVTKVKGCISFNKGHPSSPGMYRSQARFKGQFSDLQGKQGILYTYRHAHTLTQTVMWGVLLEQRAKHFQPLSPGHQDGVFKFYFPFNLVEFSVFT